MGISIGRLRTFSNIKIISISKTDQYTDMVKSYLKFENSLTDEKSSKLWTNYGITFSPTRYYTGSYSGYVNNTYATIQLGKTILLENDFTFECCLYLNNTNSYGKGIFGTMDMFNLTINPNGTLNPNLRIATPTAYWPTLNSSNLIIPIQQWTHIAYVREGNNIYVFVNGIREKVGTANGSVGTAQGDGIWYLGRGRDWQGAGTSLVGTYIDQMRFTVGVARYITSFDTSSIIW